MTACNPAFTFRGMPSVRTGIRARLLALVLSVGAATGAVGQEAGAVGARLQVSDTLLQLRLSNGEQYVGTIVAAEADSVTLQAASGTRIRLARAQVVAVGPARGSMRGAAFWPEDPNRTRLFFSPTGRSLRAGDGYFGVYELFIPFLAYGVTDRIILAGGSPFYLALTGEITPPIYFAPKVQLVRTAGCDGSVGGLMLVIPEDDETYTLGILYGVGTFGSSDRSVSAGLGWGYVEDEISSRPIAMIGGETRVGRYTKLMTENVFAPGEDGVILSGGMRFFGSRLSADAGLIGFVGSNDTECCFPLVNFVYNFGGGR